MWDIWRKTWWKLDPPSVEHETGTFPVCTNLHVSTEPLFIMFGAFAAFLPFFAQQERKGQPAPYFKVSLAKELWMSGTNSPAATLKLKHCAVLKMG